jgi:RNA polymerase sigma factor (sigma-70 family)
MAGGSASSDIVNQLDILASIGATGCLSDPQLLQRFLDGPGAVSRAALAALVVRHGPMVLRACRHALGDPHDAEDAFQATFLLLASKAGSVRNADSVAGWLHGVAVRVALRAKADAVRRRIHERRGAVIKAAESGGIGHGPESWPELHEEIARLPGRYREPVVLCYLEGLSTEAAAARIGCPRGTVLSRLSRARERLRGRMARRGLTLPAAFIAAIAMSGAASAALPAILLDATDRALFHFAGRQASRGASASATALAKEMLHAMMISRLKELGAAAAILGISALGAGAIVTAGHGSATAQAQGVTGMPGPQSPAAKAEPAIEEIRAQLEAAKARVALTEAVLERAKKDAANGVPADSRPPKYLYEGLPPDGLTPKDFEAKLAEHAALGRDFVGQVTMKLDNGSGPALVFRERPRTAPGPIGAGRGPCPARRGCPQAYPGYCRQGPRGLPEVRPPPGCRRWLRPIRTS